MKKKIGDLTIREAAAICEKYCKNNKCIECPFCKLSMGCFLENDEEELKMEIEVEE